MYTIILTISAMEMNAEMWFHSARVGWISPCYVELLLAVNPTRRSYNFQKCRRRTRLASRILAGRRDGAVE